MRRYFALARAATSICVIGAAALLIISEARAQAPLLDPGWQFYGGGQSGGVNNGFIAHTFGPGQYGYQPAPAYTGQVSAAPQYSTRSSYQTAPMPPQGYRQPAAPRYYATVSSPPPGVYQQPAPRLYYAPTAQQHGAYQQPVPLQYYASPPRLRGGYQASAAKYYAAAPAPQGRGIQTPAYYQQPAPQQYYAQPPQQPATYQPAPQATAYQQPPQYDQPPPFLQQLFGRHDWSPGYAPSSNGDLARPMVDPKYDRQVVDYPAGQPPGTIIIDTPHFFLYLVLPGGKALRYGIGVGRPGFTWAGIKEVSAMREWPDWRPPDDMLKRRPDLPRFMPGGPENPLGARAMYLGSTLYRIHGSNEPWTIGTQVSSGCIRLRNEDVIDLYGRVKVGTKVIVI